MEMSTFDHVEAISDVKSLMQLTGCWPLSDSSFKTKIISISCVTLLVVFLATTFMKAISDVSDFEVLSFGVVCFLAQLNCLVKYSVVLLNATSFLDVIDHLRNPHFTSHRKEYDFYLKDNIELSVKIRNVMRVSAFGLILFTCVTASPLSIPFEERPLPIPFPVDFKDKSLWSYFAVIGVQLLGAMIVVHTTPCFDSLLCSFMVLAIGQLKLLQKKIIETVDEAARRSGVDEKFEDPLRGCIQQHIAIEKFIASIEDTFAWCFLAQVIVSLTIICFIGFNLVLFPLISLQNGRTVFFFSAATVELVMFCIPGNELILESEKIRDACYVSKWNRSNRRVQKSLFLIMERSKRPLQLTAAKFVSLSLPTLLSIMRSALSYFMVLWQMYRDSGHN